LDAARTASQAISLRGGAVVPIAHDASGIYTAASPRRLRAP
jgi:hypothetical protein